MSDSESSASTIAPPSNPSDSELQNENFIDKSKANPNLDESPNDTQLKTQELENKALTGWKLWFLQLGALLKKNWHLTLRDWSWLICLAPLVVHLLLFIIILAIDSDPDNILHPGSDRIEEFTTNCDLGDSNCISLAIIPSGTPFTSRFGEQNPTFNVAEYDTEAELLQIIDEGDIIVENALIFSNASPVVLGGDIDYRFRYEIDQTNVRRALSKF